MLLQSSCVGQFTGVGVKPTSLAKMFDNDVQQQLFSSWGESEVREHFAQVTINHQSFPFAHPANKRVTCFHRLLDTE